MRPGDGEKNTQNKTNGTHLLGFGEVDTVCCLERHFAQSLRSTLHHLVQRIQDCEHPIDVALSEVQPRGLFEALVPHLVPQNRDADELLRDHPSLVNELRPLRAHPAKQFNRGVPPRFVLRLGGHGEGVDERLRVLLPNLREKFKC